MKLPELRIGDVVMLQSGSMYLTITALDTEAQLATCIHCSDGCLVTETLPFRTLVPVDLPAQTLEPGDSVMCRSTLEFMFVLQFDEETRTAICQGKREIKILPVGRLLRHQIRYEA